MKVKLNVLERVLLLNMLPQRGNLVTCRAASNTGKIITITKEEEQEFELKKEGGMTTWNEAGREEKEFTLPPSSIKLIRDTLYKLDEEKSLPANAVSLCEKFLPGEGDVVELDDIIEVA
jgi:hypothetical protein